MTITVVNGLQWGDEGKGKIVDIEAARHDVVVRFNGGANAGHTIVVDGKKIALHQIPSGIHYPKILNVIANGVVLDLPSLLKEMAEIAGSGIELAHLSISSRAHMVMPWHKMEDALLESAMSKGKKIGTTGRGIGPCYADKARRVTALRVVDLYSKQLQSQIEQICTIKNCALKALAKLSKSPFKLINPERLYREYLAYAEEIQPYAQDTASVLRRALRLQYPVLFEGANGFLLDVDHGTYPFVTSSTTSALGIYAGAGIPANSIPKIIGVMKAYTTRVGEGPLPTELNDETGAYIRERGHEYGTTTGRPRRCGWLDIGPVKYSASTSGATELAVMLLDVLSGLPKLKVCLGYKHNNKIIDDIFPHTVVMQEVEPNYVELDGFSEDIRGCRRFEDLPKAAQDYIKFIERCVDVPVKTISVGPDREETIVR